MSKTAKKTTQKAAATKTESKAEKFTRLAPKRVVKAMNSIVAIRKLANRTNYDWTDEQAEKILGALANELKQLQEALAAKTAVKESVEFEL